MMWAATFIVFKSCVCACVYVCIYIYLGIFLDFFSIELSIHGFAVSTM